MREPPLYRKILLACADPDTATAAVAQTAALAALCRAEVVLLHVAEPKEYLDWAEKHQYDRVAPLPIDALQSFRLPYEPLLARLQQVGVQATLIIETGEAGSQICRIAREEAMDLVVLAAVDRGFWQELLHSSVSGYVLRHAPCSVLMARQDASPDPGR